MFCSYNYNETIINLTSSCTEPSICLPHFDGWYSDSGFNCWTHFQGAALSPTSSHDDEDDDGEQQIMEEMLLNRTTAMLAQQHNMTPSRMLQNKSRLETLPEAEEENITKSSSSSSISSQLTSLTASDCTMSCPVTTQVSIVVYVLFVFSTSKRHLTCIETCRSADYRIYD